MRYLIEGGKLMSISGRGRFKEGNNQGVKLYRRGRHERGEKGRCTDVHSVPHWVSQDLGGTLHCSVKTLGVETMHYILDLAFEEDRCRDNWKRSSDVERRQKGLTLFL